VQLGHKRFRPGEHPRAHADLLEEGNEPHVGQAVAVGKDFADIARIGQPPALGHAQEEPGEPVGEVTADDEQVVVLERVEKFFRRQVLALQRADELEHVLVGNDIGRRGREPAEQMVDHGPLQVVAFDREVGNAVRRVGDHLGVGRTAEADLVDRLLEQRIERHGDVEVEVRDLCQLPQWQRRLERRLAHDRAQPRVGLLAAAMVGQVAADYVVQRERPGERCGVDVEPGGQFFGKPFQQEPRAILGFNLEELGTDDGDDPLLLDIVEQVVPDVVVEDRGRGGFRHGFGVHRGCGGGE